MLDGMKEDHKMDHFLHQHPLEPIEVNSVGAIQVCNGCREVLSGEAYNCDECKFFLHKSCAEDYPKSLQHFFHNCPLTLEISTTYICDACDHHPTDLTYHCQQCDFFMDVMCANLTASGLHHEDSVEHFCHYHQLKLCENIEIDGKVCHVCGGSWSNPFYGCSPCGFYIHKSCMDDLPRATDHPIHDCTLFLCTFAPRPCVVCSKNDCSLIFRCGHCQLDICVRCANDSREDLCNGRKFKSIYHKHVLTLSNLEEYHRTAYCVICSEQCTDRAYVCSFCDVWFHEHCARLSREIVHPYHPDHRLTLRVISLSAWGNVNCSLCSSEVLAYEDLSWPRYAYYCNECYFQLDILCAISIPCIEYDGHDHFLSVIENMPRNTKCYACGRSCLGHSIFHCLKCDNFSLHLSCGPLPCAIKHKCHVHPLILEDFEVEDYGTGMLACHVCEGDRNPRLCAYLCASGCEMICDIGCAKSEIISILQGKQGDARLRSVISNIPGKVAIQHSVMDSDVLYAKEKPPHFFVDIVHKIYMLQYTEQDGLGVGLVEESDASEDENEGMDVDRYVIYKQVDKNRNFCYGEESKRVECGYRQDGFAYRWDGSEGEHQDGEKADDEIMSLYSKEALMKYMQDLDSINILLTEAVSFISQHNGFVVKGNYFLPQSLVPFIPVFEDFLAKHDVVDAKYKNEKKSHAIFVLCCVVHSMYMTKVVDVTEETISQWLSCLKLLQRAGFQVGFLIDQTKCIARASFLVTRRRLIDMRYYQINSEIEGLSKKIARLAEELEEAKGDMQKTLVRKDHIRSHAVAATKTMKKPYEEAMRAKWKPAVNGL